MYVKDSFHQVAQETVGLINNNLEESHGRSTRIVEAISIFYRWSVQH